jgi:hypothetical protein
MVGVMRVIPIVSIGETATSKGASFFWQVLRHRFDKVDQEFSVQSITLDHLR